MSRSVLIIELEQKNHLSLVAGLIDFFHKEDFVIYTALRPDFYEDLFNRRSFKMDYAGYPDNINPWQFLYSLNFDNIILCSSYEINLPYMFLLFRSRKVTLVLHNINSYFKFNVSSVKFFLKSFYRIILRKFSRNFIVMNPVLKRYLMESYRINIQKCAWFPFKWINLDLEFDLINSQERPSVVFPGTIDFNKRYYKDFVKLASVFPSVDFVILGTFATAKDKILFSRLMDNFGSLTNVVFFNRRLLEDEFSNYLINCLFIYSFLRVDYRFNEYTEMYGISKETGVLYDALTNQKILVINEEFLFPEKLKTIIKTFSNFDEQSDYIESFLEGCYSGVDLSDEIRNYYVDIDLNMFI